MEKQTKYWITKLGLLTIVFMAFSHLALAQSNLIGPNPVEPGSIETYTYNDGISYTYPNWDVTGGTVLSSSDSGTTYTATVSWIGSEGTGSITFKKKQTVLETLTVIREYGAAPPTIVTELNSVHNITPRVAATDVSTLGNTDKVEAVTYFDGLGRARQSVAIRAGGSSEDIITHIAYDEFGRSVKDYLPYSATTDIGTYRVNALDDTNTYYDASAYDDDFPGMTTADINPYSEKAFDNSPLNRVLQQAAPGKDWKLGNGHEIEMEHLYNSTNEVRNYTVDLTKYTASGGVITYSPTLISSSGYYAANELYKTVTKDENHDGSSSKLHTTEEFKTKQGQVVLKRTYALVSSIEEAHDTYYVYDDFGNLSFVLPPKSEPHAAKPDATELTELCYQYKYDDRNRLVEKKIPGKGWEYIVYDKLDRPVITQDAILKAQGKWLFTAYDVFGRVVYTGKVDRPSWGRATMQNHVNSGSYLQFVNKLSASITINGVTIYYPKCFTNTNYITDADIEVLTINYYDNYTFDLAGGTSETAYGITPTTAVKGLATGSKVRVLDTNDWITTVTYYDDKARPIYIYSNNDYLDTKDKIKSQLTFDGRASETTSTHDKQVSGFWLPTITVVDKFSYDHANRLVEHRQKVNNAALDEIISSNDYDDLGQLVTKGVGGKQNVFTRLQDVDYSYNIRGWLKSINGDPNSGLGNNLFAFKIEYNNSPDTSIAPNLFNGNISFTRWRTANDNTSFGYYYNYDALNRITKADFTGGGHWARYKLNYVNYDKNGNITGLKRQGHVVADPDRTQSSDFGVMDELVYTYEDKSNQLKKVLDNGNDTYGFNDGSNTATEYTYDDNGNMLIDLNKGISSNITYNHLNLPKQVTLSSGNIQYIYDATGVKQKKIVSTGTTTDYAGNFIYENNSLKMFSHPEGYVEPRPLPKSVAYDYVYQYKDHLGNIRLTYADSDGNGSINSATEIIEENNYYPFGLKHKGYNDVVSANVNSIATKYKYNGKELNDELGLDWYDFGARNYDASLARWFGLDPLAEKYTPISPYTFAGNSPTVFVDPNGKEIINVNGGVKFTENDAVTAFIAVRDLQNYSDRTGSNINIHFVPEATTPNIYRLTVRAFMLGHPNVLTYDSNKERQKIRRSQSTGTIPSRGSEGLQRDEYPYASTFEGGTGAVVDYVPSKENSRQGGMLSALYSQMQTGDRFLVFPLPDPKRKPIPVPSPIDDTTTTPDGVPMPVIPIPVETPQPKPKPSNSFWRGLSNFGKALMRIPVLIVTPPCMECATNSHNKFGPTKKLM